MLSGTRKKEDNHESTKYGDKIMKKWCEKL